MTEIDDGDEYARAFRAFRGERLRTIVDKLKASYAVAEPFPHATIDELFPSGLLSRVLDEFFPAEDRFWEHRFDGEDQFRKRASEREDDWGAATKMVFSLLRSSTFITFLQQLTGIDGLLSDPSLSGSGLHQTLKGGHLGIHADFNRLGKHYQLDRRVNLFVYLNPEWQPGWGGELELLNQNLTGARTVIEPLFGRVAIFSSTSFSYHGHPNPWSPTDDKSRISGVPRRSIAIYYYTNGRPAHEIAGDAHCGVIPDHCIPYRATEHSTVFKKATVVVDETAESHPIPSAIPSSSKRKSKSSSDRGSMRSLEAGLEGTWL
jgi:Rps23 Pro-64 3,4-dihydroxylase Tpa1-like proline 4-hydroxylase